MRNMRNGSFAAPRRTANVISLLVLSLSMGVGILPGCFKDSAATPKSPPPSATNPAGSRTVPESSVVESHSVTGRESTPPAAPKEVDRGEPRSLGDATTVAARENESNDGSVPSAAKAPAPAADDESGNGTAPGLEGLDLPVPEGWKNVPIAPSPMGPVAVYAIPTTMEDGGEGEPLQVRIFHYPNMRGMDDMNIARWVGMVAKPDGTPCTEADAKIIHTAENGVAVTLVDVQGKVSTSMGSMMPGEAIEDGRMIAAILNHPKGPHFIRISGSAKAIEEHGEAIFQFINGGKVR